MGLLSVCVWLQGRHRLAALPPGWFYNGREYVSMDAQRTIMHPGSYSVIRRVASRPVIGLTAAPSNFRTDNTLSAG